MEKYYLEIPTVNRKKDAINFIEEFHIFNSDINGVGGLDRFLDNYEGWLDKLEEDYKRISNEEKVPARTFFLVRKSDNKIIGMINIRLALNEKLKKFGGNIGYSIRPTERGNGFNNINLYLGLLLCNKYNIDKVLLDANLENPASWKTMEKFSGRLLREYYDDVYANCTVRDYEIEVKPAVLNYKKEMEQYIEFDNFIV